MAYVQAALAIYGAYSTSQAGEDVEDTALEAARRERVFTGQVNYRSKQEQDRYTSAIPVGAEQSGVEADSRSVLEVTNEAINEFEFDRLMNIQNGADRARAFTQSGANARSQANAQALIGLGQGLYGAYSTAQRSGSWWEI